MNLKIAVINFSGNVGKTLVASYLLKDRMPDTQLVSIETINSDEGTQDSTIKAKQFGSLQEALLINDSLIIDIGASNVEETVRLMKQYHGSHEDIDYFIIPVTREKKQIRDSIQTMDALINEIGIPPSKIKFVFNKIESDDLEEISSDFSPIFLLGEKCDGLKINPNAVILFNEIYQLIRSKGFTISELVNDQTDYRAQLKQADITAEQRKYCVDMITMKRLAVSANENLDQVFKSLFGKAKK